MDIKSVLSLMPAGRDTTFSEHMRKFLVVQGVVQTIYTIRKKITKAFEIIPEEKIKPTHEAGMEK